MRIIFSSLIAIYRKELQSYFVSPFAYIIAGVFWLLSGVLFLMVLQDSIVQAVSSDQFGLSAPIDVPYNVMLGFSSLVSIISFFLLPMLSMGLYAEERKRGTLELLATSPVTNWVVALGKLLGVLTFFMTMVIPLIIYETFALSPAEPPLQLSILLLGYVGLILMAAAVLSIGMFISSLTDSSILAAILTFVVMMFLLIMDGIADAFGSPIGDALGHLSLLRHYGNLAQGVLDSSSIILFLSYIFLGLFLTAQAIEAFRFQRS
ncbi:MAG: ABC transporter permease [Leptolyngbyaceae bacterium]|nr:ABC transporter permease [Leptolyngbyaceae bacterium]